jgi:hypothetical protein
MMQRRERVALNMPTPIADLVDATRATWESVSSPLVDSFLADWPAMPRSRPATPAALPVLRHLATIADAPACVARDLVAAVLRTAAVLAWRQTYTLQELGAEFLDNYGYTEILGSSGPRCSDRLASGFLLLGPDTLYPRHRHRAEEIYLPLTGQAEWQQGDALWRSHRPGTVIHHRSEEPHAMRTTAEPLLALYLWRSDGLTQRAQLVD